MTPTRLNRLMTQVIQGMTVGTLARVLVRHRFRLDRRYWDRLLYLVGVGLYNSALRHFEKRCNHYKLEGVAAPAPPVFVLGHWRSGTTHLHNLLSLDPNFYAPTAYQAMFPHHFLYSRVWGAPFFDRFAPKKRPMDNMAFFAETPHEDEFALAGLCAVSPYLAFLFPADADPGLCALDPDQLAPEALQQWRESFLYFLKKLAFHKGKRLVLKSPPHTGRVRVLLELCPGAKFVHIVRNPYEVFLSTRRLWTGSLIYSHLQSPAAETVEERIFAWYMELFRLYQRDRGLIPAGDLVEIRYEDLVARPRDTLEGIYQGLGLTGFGAFWERASRYLAALGDYRAGRYQPDADTRQRVARRWGPAFAAYGYPLG